MIYHDICNSDINVCMFTSLNDDIQGLGTNYNAQISA